MRHELKIREDFATAIMENSKTFEVRESDRVFNAGDLVRFKAVSMDGKPVADHPINGQTFEITYVLHGWGIGDDHVVFSIKRIIPLDDFLKVAGVVKKAR